MKKYLKAIVTLFLLTNINACKTKEIVPIPPILDTITISETTISSTRLSSAINDIGNLRERKKRFQYW